MVTYVKRVTVTGAEPVTLERAMLHCRVDGFGESPPHEDEALISALIPVAREHVEDYTGRALALSTWEQRADCLADVLPLRVRPVASVESVTYIDVDGVEQTLDAALWRFDDNPAAPCVRRVWGATYPLTRGEADAVRIHYTAGPTDGESPNPHPLPRPLYQAVLLILGDLYENRESTLTGSIAVELPNGAKALMNPYRVNVL